MNVTSVQGRSLYDKYTRVQFDVVNMYRGALLFRCLELPVYGTLWVFVLCCQLWKNFSASYLSWLQSKLHSVMQVHLVSSTPSPISKAWLLISDF